jgi:hypothetical protein
MSGHRNQRSGFASGGDREHVSSTGPSPVESTDPHRMSLIVTVVLSEMIKLVSWGSTVLGIRLTWVDLAVRKLECAPCHLGKICKNREAVLGGSQPFRPPTIPNITPSSVLQVRSESSIPEELEGSEKSHCCPNAALSTRPPGKIYAFGWMGGMQCFKERRTI